MGEMTKSQEFHVWVLSLIAVFSLLSVMTPNETLSVVAQVSDFTGLTQPAAYIGGLISISVGTAFAVN